MQTIIFILLGISAIFLLLLIITSFFSPYLRVEKSILVSKPKEDIFPHLASFNNFVVWSPWSKKDLNMTSEFSGREMEIGSTYSWSGNKKVGSGKMILVELRENKFVRHELYFGKQAKSFADFTIEEIDGKCKVTWGLNSVFSFPLSRLFKPMIKKYVGKDYEEGLKDLKSLLEN